MVIYLILSGDKMILRSIDHNETKRFGNSKSMSKMNILIMSSSGGISRIYSVMRGERNGIIYSRNINYSYSIREW